MDFSGLLDGLDASVEAHLCDDAIYVVEGRPPTAVRVMLEFPRQQDRLDAMAFTRSRPVMRVARAACPALREGHSFLRGDDRWDVAEAPVAEDDGRWWVFEVQPG